MAGKLVWVGVLVGSTLGGYVPTLFGVGLLSMWGVLGSTVGGVAGIWVGLKLADRWG